MHLLVGVAGMFSAADVAGVAADAAGVDGVDEAVVDPVANVVEAEVDAAALEADDSGASAEAMLPSW